MTRMKAIADILSSDDEKEEVYISDEKKRQKRGYLGRYSRSSGSFNFINLIKNWENLVGQLMAKNTIPLKIRKGTLIIATKHPIFAQELQFLVPEIIKKIQTDYPELGGKLRDIKFAYSAQTAQMFAKDTKPKELEKVKKRETTHRFSPEFQQKTIEAKRLLADIEDDEIRESLFKYLMS